MKIQRRDLLKFGMAQAIVGSIPFQFPTKAEAQSSSAPPLRKEPSILQGATDETKTQFSIVFEASIDLQISVSNQRQQIWQPDNLEVIKFPGHDKKITKVYFSHLNPADRYHLILQDAQNQKIIDIREFRTLNLNSKDLRFAICSCMDHVLHQPEIWQNLVLQNPQIIFYIGDQVYVDRDLPKTGMSVGHMWNKFCDARATLEIYFSKKLIPIIGTWDDHDFGVNDGTSLNFPFVNESQKNFLFFMAQKESHCRGLIKGPGVSSAFQFGSQLFILTDGRSFRKEADSKDRHAHWGEAQETWMMDLIRKNQGPTWLVNGSQVFPSFFRRESMSAHHPVQFQALLKELKMLSSKVIFITGDIHYSEISKIEASDVGYTTYELTSSSMHSKGLPVSTGFIHNPRRITSTGERNYVMVDSKAEGLGALFQATSFSAKGQVLFQETLRV